MESNMNDDIDLFEDIYESFVNNVASLSLVQNQSRIRDAALQDAMRLNTDVISNVYNIRRYLEFEENLNSFNTQRMVPLRQTVTYTVNNYNNNGLTTSTTAAIDDSFLPNLLQNFFGSVLSTTFESPSMEDVKVTITEDDFNKLKTLQVDENNISTYESNTCPVCLESIDKGNYLTFLPCSHFFHQSCIKNWLCEEKVNCPVCRKDVRESFTQTNNETN